MAGVVYIFLLAAFGELSTFFPQPTCCFALYFRTQRRGGGGVYWRKGEMWMRGRERRWRGKVGWGGEGGERQKDCGR